MKKLTTTLILLVALMIIPFSAFAMKAITSDEMGSVTGQAGIDIAIVEEISLTVDLPTVGWDDKTGLNVDATIHAANMGITIGKYYGAGEESKNRPLSIDIRSTKSMYGAALTGADAAKDVTTLDVGLPTVKVTIKGLPTIDLFHSGAALGTLSFTGDMGIGVKSGRIQVQIRNDKQLAPGVK